MHARDRSRRAAVIPRRSSDSVSQPPPASGEGAPEAAGGLCAGRSDALLIAALLALAVALFARTGFQRGTELLPFPDSLEYATLAVNMDRGIGPMLHFGGYSYPPRYTLGYPLMLAAAYPMVGEKPENLCLVTALTGLAAIVALYLLALWTFGRPSAFFAAAMLATSPLFVGYSTYVMSDVPALAAALVAALLFLYAAQSGRSAAWLLCGLCAGFSTIVRPTNGALLAGIGVAIWAVRPRKFTLAHVAAFAAGFAMFPGWQAWLNLRQFGSVFSSGYSFWMPQYYDTVATAFQPRFLFSPENEAYSHGNLVSYLLALLGLDGIFGDPTIGIGITVLPHARYAIYPFAAAVFAAVGIADGLRARVSATTTRSICMGLGFLGALVLIYLFYFFLDARFLLPASMVLFAGAGHGLVIANRRMGAGGWRAAAVLTLDLLLGAAILVEVGSRLASAPKASPMVAEVRGVRPRLEKALVVSDVSLQWLELYAGGKGTDFVGLNTLFHPDFFPEYHLHFLADKKADGFGWPIPRILFPGGQLDESEARALAAQARAGRPLFLLVATPQSQEWSDVLSREFADIDRYFTHEAVVDNRTLGLFRLVPR